MKKNYFNKKGLLYIQFIAIGAIFVLSFIATASYFNWFSGNGGLRFTPEKGSELCWNYVEVSGKKVPTTMKPDETECSTDGDSCTIDYCVKGKCEHYPVGIKMFFNGAPFLITREPKMPDVNAYISPYANRKYLSPTQSAGIRTEWNFTLTYRPCENNVSNCSNWPSPPEDGRNINKYDYRAGGLTYKKSFSEFVGGDVGLSVVFWRTEKGAAERKCGSDGNATKILGVNPLASAIDSEVNSRMSSDRNWAPLFKKILCQESRKMQFDPGAPGGLPNLRGEKVRKDGNCRVGCGLTQVTTPPCTRNCSKTPSATTPPSNGAFWNWKTNIGEGLGVFRSKVSIATSYMNGLGVHYSQSDLELEVLQLYHGTYPWGHYWVVRNGQLVRNSQDPYVDSANSWPTSGSCGNRLSGASNLDSLNENYIDGEGFEIVDGEESLYSMTI